MAGMTQSYKLPSGMLEALGQYKEALKSAKTELRDVEREVNKAIRSGGDVSPAMRTRLTAARTTRDRLENALIQDRARKTEEDQGIGSQLLRYGPTGVATSLATTYANKKVSAFLGSMTTTGNMMIMTPAQHKFLSFMGGAGINSVEQLFTADGMKRAASYAASSFAQRTAPGLATKATAILGESAGAAATTATVLALPAAVLAAGVGIGVVRGMRRKMRLQAAQGEINNQEFFSNIIRNVSDGGDLARNFDKIRKVALGEGKRQADNLVRSGFYRNIKAWMFKGDSEALDLQDKIAQNTATRIIKERRYGQEFGRYMSDEMINQTRRVQKNAEMYKELGYINYFGNRVLELLSGSTNTDFYDFYRIYTLGLDSEVQTTEDKVNEKMKKEGEEKWDRAVRLRQAEWNNRRNANFALQRIDAHERQNAMAAFQSDLLTRGLTWSQ